MPVPLILRTRLLMATSLLVAAVICSPRDVHAQSSPIVRTQAGELQGLAELDVFAFKGIPYAAPPVGDLRWREPRPAAPWPGVRKAGAYGNACIQVPGLSEANGGSPGARLDEDCLYLNVWTPGVEGSAKLPVMVWIHGGAFVFGSGGLSLYSGAPLAKKGAVVVTINYRLAQLGFFAHPALEKESPGGPANFGLLDQIEALKWVQQNIAQFGGDPKNVTIMGQSAGGKSVLALLASPLARGLFHKGVAQSSYIVPDATRTKAIAVGVKVADALGLPGATATAAQLRAIPAGNFGQLKEKGLSNAPVPIAGDKVLPQSIQATFAAGKEAPLPLIVGNTGDDVSVVAAFGIDPSAVLKRLGAAGFFVRLLYPGVNDNNELARQATRDLVFTMPARWVADRHAKRAPTWRYYFDYVAVKERARFPNGVGHGAEIAYFLNTVDIFEGTKDVVTPEDRALARRASDYLFEFAHSGEPASRQGPAWPSHSAGQDKTLVFGDPVAVQPNFMKARLNVFLGVSRIVDRILGRR